MRKLIWTLAVTLLMLSPVGCGGKAPAPSAKGAEDAKSAATPVFEDGFEKGKSEAWEATKPEISTAVDEASEEKAATETPDSSEKPE